MTEPHLAIVGVGLVGGFGLGKQAVLEALRAGGKANGTIPVASPSGQHQLPVYQADVSPLSRFVAGAAVRRMNRFAKLAVLGGSLALEDAGWNLSGPRDDIGLVVASGYGALKSTFDFLDSMIDAEGQFPSPTLFSNSVHSSAASHLSITLNLRGPSLTVSQFEMSTISALLTARQWLVEGQVRAVLFGSVEEICPILGYSYERFYGTAAYGPLEPFSWDKQTAVLGEGAAFLLLTLATDERPAYGHIRRLAWTQSRSVAVPSDSLLVLGADGHTCCACDYRRLYEGAGAAVAYTPVYGTLPGGQGFDVAIAAVAAGQDSGHSHVCSVKCDANGNGGVIECVFERGDHRPG